MVLWGATFNAVVVVGVVALLLFRLPMSILCGRPWPVNLAISVLMDVRETLFQDHHPKGYLFC